MARAADNISRAIEKRAIMKGVKAAPPKEGIEVPEVDIETLRPRVEKLPPNALVNIALEHLSTLDADEQEELLAEYEGAPEEELPAEEVPEEGIPPTEETVEEV